MMRSLDAYSRQPLSPQAPANRPGALRVLGAVAAGAGAMAGFHLFWQTAGGPLCAPYLAPFGREPAELAGLLMPLLGGFVAASFERRSWWWLGIMLAFPGVWSLHILFLTGIEALYHRPPTLAEEGRFLMTEGHRFIFGLVGAYLGAWSQRE